MLCALHGCCKSLDDGVGYSIVKSLWARPTSLIVYRLLVHISLATTTQIVIDPVPDTSYIVELNTLCCLLTLVGQNLDKLRQLAVRALYEVLYSRSTLDVQHRQWCLKLRKALDA